MQIHEKQLKRLLPKERKILQYLAIYWEQINDFDFYRLIREMGIKSHDGREYSKQYVSILKNSFVKKRLLKSTHRYWGKGFQIFSDELKEHFMREASESMNFAADVKKIQSIFKLRDVSQWEYGGKKYRSRLFRDFRISIYQKDYKKLEVIRKEIERLNDGSEAKEIILSVFGDSFLYKSLDGFDGKFQEQVLHLLFQKAFDEAESTDELWSFVSRNGLPANNFERYKIEELFYRGEFEKLNKKITQSKNYKLLPILATVKMLEGDVSLAVQLFESFIGLWRKDKRKRGGFPDVWQLFLYALGLYKIDADLFNDFTGKYFPYAEKNYADSTTYGSIKAFDHYLKNNDRLAQIELENAEQVFFKEKLLACLAASIIPSLEIPFYAEDLADELKELGYEWALLEVNYLLSLKADKRSSATEKLEKKLGFKAVGKLIPPIQEWKRALNLLKIVADEDTDSKKQKSRIAWKIDFERKELQAVEQKYNRSRWSKGRKLSLKDLQSSALPLSPQDSSVIRRSLITNDDISHYSATYYKFEWETALVELIGHPNIFLAKNPAISIQLIKGEPNLQIRELKDKELAILFDTEIKSTGTIIEKETETRYKIIEIRESHLAIAEALANRKLHIPKEGREVLVDIVQKLASKITIQSDLKEHFKHLPAIKADSSIHALITPLPEGFNLGFFVKPFGNSPPYIKPGQGSRFVTADVKGVRTGAERDLKEERQNLFEIEEDCPTLAASESPDYEWNFTNLEDCLTVMTEMEKPRADGKLILEWTKSRAFKLIGNLTPKDVSISVKGNDDWFNISGEAKVSDELVFSFKELLAKLEENTSNFVEISDGNFIAITESLRKQLQSLKTALDKDHKLHRLRSNILDESIVDLHGDKAWKDHLKHIAEAKEHSPKVPKTFKGELRPYQIDGFQWLSRLAKLGVGACLADDMGLGKTIQALALLTERSEQGPALVAAPVSVLRNWVSEAKLFAPQLNVRIFGDDDRKETIENLGANDLLISSYSLLQLESELFEDIEFSTIVLDEAQAIKNRNTKRSKAIMKLKGGFRVITTGTPIENHLGELWNLFNFLNPGFLGSHKFFNERFAVPIEKNKDENARETLQKMLRPYILRRRKDDVLEELPTKTEITLSVKMAEDETAFYESIRQDALQKIDDAGVEKRDKRFRIFAELMRLRQAACHPKLVDKNVSIGSSKLDLFIEKIEELLENQHKALVFSQFVKHLSIVEESLKARGIDYHYLDGSTTANTRQKRIDAFQKGEKSIFLISLKAGGTGLNLTEADYVFHLDPWWNPAVEDQATDRVHRIGQDRPVTVYRLVSENTVEEKILQLHTTKRELADSLLSGSDSSGKLTTEDLLELMRV